MTSAAKLIFSGRSIEASRLRTTAAMTTAVGPDGQAVANQNADVIATAVAERSSVRPAAIGSYQSLRAAVGVAPLDLRSRTTQALRSRA
jgi:hypothetical protein